MNITSMAINGVLGTMDFPSGPFTELQIHPPYRAIHHTLDGVNSMFKWMHHGNKHYHQSFSFTHIIGKFKFE